jgi:uncharacterized protein YgiM (DUF1202 family)
MNPSNQITLLLPVGLIALLLNVIIDAVRLRQGHPRAGIRSVGLALVACSLITVAIVNLTFSTTPPAASAAADPSAALTAAPGTAAANGMQAGVAGNVPVRGNGAGLPGALPSAAEMTAMAEGTLPPPLMTAAASGKAPAPMMTAAAGSQAASKQVASGASDADTGVPGLPGVSISRLAAPFTIAGALIVLLAGIVLFRNERHHPDFDPSASRGLLNAGAGFFVLVAAVVIPMIPNQSTAAAAGVAAGLTPTNGPAPTRSAIQTSTPTLTAMPSLTPTAPPTLTPTTTETPIVLYTAAAYGYGGVITTTNCTVTAQTSLNLRGDPSVEQLAIGRVFAGSLLPVTGQSPDKKWWRVVNDAEGSPVEGWVSAAYVTADSACADGSVPIISPAAAEIPEKPITATPVQPVKGTPAPAAAGTSGTCTLTTTTAASFRSGPSKSYLVIGQIPEGTALTATGRSPDRQWWRVTYTTPAGAQDGWVGAGIVIAPSACAAVLPVTLTPAP